MPVHAVPSTPTLSLPLDGVSSDIVEAPLESVREDEEEEEEAHTAPSTPMVAPRPTADGSENEPPASASANANDTKNVPALKLPDISDPEVTGGKDDGPASARLGESDEALQGEAKKLVDGQVLSARLEGGEDPSTVLPELIKADTAADGLAAEIEMEETTE